MARALRQIVKDNLEKCQAAAVAAVEAYNRPGRRFRTAQYLVMIVIAWTALFHAIFYNRGKRPWYRSPTSGIGRGIRYVRVDEEPKHWDLSECLKQYFGGDNPAERKNLEFLIALRNKIEHRHLPELDGSLYGECQAALLNLEGLIVQQFGKKYALTDSLAVSLQFTQLVPAEKKTALKALVAGVTKSVTEYIENFRGNLPATVLNSIKYSFNVFLVPKVVGRKSAADAAVEFVNTDEANQEELDRLARLNVLIREKHIPIANLACFKPGRVVAQVAQRLPFEFNMAAHTDAWRHYAVRPAGGDIGPQRTLPQYCIYDQPHRDYVYTQAWIEFLVSELSKPEMYQVVIGREPVKK